MSRRAALSPAEADDLHSRLVSDLQGLERLLDRHGEEHLCRWVRQSLSEIHQGDARGLSRLRQAYGGMGSFNDLVLDGGPDGSRSEVNAELDVLRTRIYECVTVLLHDLRLAGP